MKELIENIKKASAGSSYGAEYPCLESDVSYEGFKNAEDEEDKELYVFTVISVKEAVNDYDKYLEYFEVIHNEWESSKISNYIPDKYNVDFNFENRQLMLKRIFGDFKE